MRLNAPVAVSIVGTLATLTSSDAVILIRSIRYIGAVKYILHRVGRYVNAGSITAQERSVPITPAGIIGIIAS
jgi:hypothetical protein